MSTAIARNLMAEMKLLGMLGAFDEVRRVTEISFYANLSYQIIGFFSYLVSFH